MCALVEDFVELSVDYYCRLDWAWSKRMTYEPTNQDRALYEGAGYKFNERFDRELHNQNKLFVERPIPYFYRGHINDLFLKTPP